jgi:phenylpropionate dioxygenase-like ring-hydroxylating dioxygenase large terminal subunit
MRTDSFSANPALRTQWYVVADAADVADSPVGVTLLGHRYVLWRSSVGSLTASPDRCPHREAPLSEGSVSNGCLVCPYHAWAFAADGACVEIPSSGPDAAITPAANLELVAVRELYGLVWLCPGTPAGEPPGIPQDRDASFRRVTAGIETWRVSATRMVDNFCDVAHFPYVHADTIGPDTDPVVAPINVEPLDADFTGYRYAVDVHDEHGNDVRQIMSTGSIFRSSCDRTRSTSRVPAQGTTGCCCCAPPRSTTSRRCSPSCHGATTTTTLAVEDFLAFDRAIGAEDKAMLERIGGVLPLDCSATVSVRSDRLSVEWRRRLADLLSG